MLDKVGVALGGLLCGLLLTGDAKVAGNYPPDWSRKTCGSVCTVKVNHGGYVDAFIEKAERMVKERVTLRIDGPCASACTMAADRARPYACVTKRAVMRFHNYYDTNALGMRYRGDPSTYYRVDVVAWVQEHGGFPGKTYADDALLDMPFSEAKRFWPVCA